MIKEENEILHYNLSFFSTTTNNSYKIWNIERKRDRYQEQYFALSGMYMQGEKIKQTSLFYALAKKVKTLY